MAFQAGGDQVDFVAMRIEGGCHCGKISFTAEIDPARVVACHCSDCQVLSGSAFRVVAPAAIESFELRGEPKRYAKVAESGNVRMQAFCPECATPLFGIAPENATHVMIRLGCVKERDRLPPRAHVWHRSALPWLDALHDLPIRPKQ
jgi:hypothetical protein